MARVLSVAAALVLAGAAGCASTQFNAEHDAAKVDIDRAEQVEAPAEDLEIAKQSFDFAREAEKTARDDLDEGREDLDEATGRLKRSGQLADDKRGEIVSVRGRLADAKGQAASLEAREGQLSGQGVDSRDVGRAMGGELGLARQRVECLSQSEATLVKHIELAEAERQYSEAAREAARRMIDSAEERLEVARLLYEQAAQQGRTAEVLGLLGQRERIEQRLRP